MTVRDNIAFGLKVRKRPKAEIRERVDELLSLVQLQGLGHRYPAQLSGGQRQRMGLARALAPEPQVLLLDEPFGALDARVRAELREWLRQLHDVVHVTTVFVTHDQEEAMEISDQIAVLNHGRLGAGRRSARAVRRARERVRHALRRRRERRRRRARAPARPRAAAEPGTSRRGDDRAPDDARPGRQGRAARRRRRRDRRPPRARPLRGARPLARPDGLGARRSASACSRRSPRPTEAGLSPARLGG